MSYYLSTHLMGESRIIRSTIIIPTKLHENNEEHLIRVLQREGSIEAKDGQIRTEDPYQSTWTPDREGYYLVTVEGSQEESIRTWVRDVIQASLTAAVRERLGVMGFSVTEKREGQAVVVMGRRL